ncbi:MAG: HigA family addiction module antidote protein [Acetobacteraceae bacterium]|nr:HigA family addiction module antidote protein [Acetobacteraceae bacterium]
MTEYRVKRSAAWQPTHPGVLLRDEVLPALRLTVKGAAEKLGVSRQTLHAILAERAGITPEMAVRIGKFCGNGPTLWLRMQAAYDLWKAERDLAETVKKIPTMRAA